MPCDGFLFKPAECLLLLESSIAIDCDEKMLISGVAPLFLFYDHDVCFCNGFLYDAEVSVLFKVLEWVFYKEEQMLNVPLTWLVHGSVEKMCLPLEICH